MDERCDYCGGRWDRPGLDGCTDARHAAPTPAQRIVADIERELDGRRGLGWGSLDSDTAGDLRDRLAEIVAGHLAKLGRDA
jgi:hypothetical protein